jgi:hypothetical protein
VALLLDERILGDGRVARTWASTCARGVRIADDDGSGGELSIVALERVMTRYGRELDAGIALDGDALDFGDGRRLRRLRHRAPVDAIARDYLVWECPGHAPLAALATHATAALRYLALRVAAEREEDPTRS